MHHTTSSRSPHNALHSPSYWGERSEPHTCGENGKLSIYMYIYMFGTCVFRICIHPAPFVRDAIFPHCMLVHISCNHCCSRLTRDKTNRKERLNVGTSVTGT